MVNRFPDKRNVIAQYAQLNYKQHFKEYFKTFLALQVSENYLRRNYKRFFPIFVLVSLFTVILLNWL